MIEVIDNFLPEESFTKLQNFVDSTLWRFFNGTAITNANEELGNFFFFQNMITHKMFINCLMKSFSDNFNLKEEIQISRCQLNLTLYNPHGYESVAHVDSTKPHYVLLLYVNETDGDTVVYDKMCDHKDNHMILAEHDRNSSKQLTSVSPKPNRCLFFDGRYYHSYSFPKYHNKRIVVNCNLIVGER